MRLILAPSNTKEVTVASITTHSSSSVLGPQVLTVNETDAKGQDHSPQTRENLIAWSATGTETSVESVLYTP
jgi:hypothetical protein